MENSSTSPPSQLSPTNWPPNAFSILPTVLVAAGLIIATVVGAALGIACGFALGETRQSLTHPHLSPGLVISQIVTYVPIVIYLAVALPAVAHQSLAQLGLRTPRGRDLLYGAGGAVLMMLAVMLVALIQKALLGYENEQKVVELFRDATHGLLLDLFIATAVVLAPFVEELVFRGFVFNALLRRMPFAFAAVISGLLFGAAHGEVLFIVPLAAGGVVLAWVYYTSGSLWSSILAHGLFNTFNLIGVFLTHAPKT